MGVEVEDFAFEVGGYRGSACDGRRGVVGGEDSVRMRVGGYVIRFHGCGEGHLVPVHVVYCDLDRPSVLVRLRVRVVRGPARRGFGGVPYPRPDGWWEPRVPTVRSGDGWHSRRMLTAREYCPWR